MKEYPRADVFTDKPPNELPRPKGPLHRIRLKDPQTNQLTDGYFLSQNVI